MIHILDPESFRPLFAQLQEDTPAAWGIMKAHHMVEHLAFAIMGSSGKIPLKLYIPIEKAEAIKQSIIHGDKEIPMGVKAPMLSDSLPKLVTPNLNAAFQYLEQEIDYFQQYYQKHPNEKPNHPLMGPLSYDEWVIFHNKHFKHHLKQFGLV
ncbi:MAG: DUF1569 domain-containing protein [Cyclobacteriaceae bacterium]|nr:hypothetical protein [Cyclobacteriaceae bacterium]MCH8516344.1 DUF1569 domain-containing protein [Cyclobacteriaceae bacterium]